MDVEMRTHLEMRVEQLRMRGLSKRDAEVEALRRFGDSDEYRAYSQRRVARRSTSLSVTEWADGFAQDVRFASRQFGRSAGFTALAVLTLALGIGANTAIFTVVHRLLIAPLPFADGDRIVKLVVGAVSSLNPGAPPAGVRTAWVDGARSLEMIAAVNIDAIYTQDFGDPQDSVPALVTSNYLRLLGLRPALGRSFGPDDERGATVAMISYGKWQREYGGRANVLGSVVKVDSRQYTIVGVMPADISVPMTQGSGVSGNLRQPRPAIWIPATLDSVGGDYVFGKLRAGVTARQASAELTAILRRIPRANGSQVPTLGWRSGATEARAMRAQDFLDPRETQTVEVLFVAVGVLLLIACANVANLLMSRAWTRRREFAVRTALGAGRTRLVRQVLTESVLLALSGGLLGIGVAWATLRVIIALRPPALANLSTVEIESAVLLWSAVISVITGLVFGSAPALFAGGQSAGDVLRSETRGASGGSSARRMRSTLIVLEIAMSLVLLVGASLLIRSFVGLQKMPLGFQPHGLVAADVILTARREWTAADRAARRHALLQQIRAIPGVSGASVGMMPGLGWRVLAPLETEPDANGQTQRITASTSTFITADYFRLTGMSLVEGRLPDSLTWRNTDDATASAAEIVISRSMARRLWPNANAIGARFGEGRTPGFTRAGRSDKYVVVGVVDDTHMPTGRDQRWMMEMFVPMPSMIMDVPFVLRTTLSEREIVTAVRRVAADLDHTLRAETGRPIGAILREITVGDAYIRDSLAPTRFAMALLTAFALLALILSGVGLYGVIAYSVTQRTREIGVRVALGADARSVKQLVIGGGVKLAALGVAIGVIAAFATTRLLSSLLYGVSPADPASFVGIAALVVGIALAASYIPARRAVRIDPMEALRAD
jgi:predicted permease